MLRSSSDTSPASAIVGKFVSRAVCVLLSEQCQAVERARPLAKSQSADQQKLACSFLSDVLPGDNVIDHTISLYKLAAIA